MFKELFTAFESAGEELFFVGGFVRDKLRHNMQSNPLDALVDDFVPNDVDFATSSGPKKTIKILKDHGFKAIPIGMEFGTIQTFVGNMKVEITTFRCDESYTKGSRKPAVKFGRTIKDDLARRDLTINAIAMRQDGSIIDPFKGCEDLKEGVLVTPIHPAMSFSDDPLRMLRVCRFQAKGFGKVTWEVSRIMRELAHKIKEISSERVFEEMSKLLMLEDPTAGLRLMSVTGLMENLFPEIQTMINFKNDQGPWHSKAVWPHTLGVIRQSPRILEVRWAALFHDVAKPQTYVETGTGVHFYQHDWKGSLMWESVARRLKVGNAFKKHVSVLIYEHLQPSLLAESNEVTTKALRRLVKRTGDKLENLFHLSLADITSHNPERVRVKREACLALKERIDKLIEREDIVKLKLPKGTGMVMAKALGIKPGPQLGEIMKKLNKKLIDGEINLSDDFVKIAKEFIE